MLVFKNVQSKVTGKKGIKTLTSRNKGRSLRNEKHYCKMNR